MLAKLKSIRPNRIAVYLTALAGLATALAPVIANLDLQSTAGVIAGFAGAAGVVSVWLKGWSTQEAAVNEASLQLEVLAAQRTSRAPAEGKKYAQKLDLPR